MARKSKELLKQAPEILRELHTVLTNNNYKAWLDFGTLLGAVREKGIIKHDLDIDLSIDETDFTKDFILNMKNVGFNLQSQFADKDQYYEVRFVKDSIAVDFFIAKRDQDSNTYKIYDFCWDNSLSNKERRAIREKHGSPMSVNEVPYFELTEIEFMGLSFKIPENYHKHLETLYGSDYMIPNPQWNHKSRSCRKQVEGQFVRRKKFNI